MNIPAIQRIFAVAISVTLSVYMWQYGIIKHIGWERLIIICPMPTILLLMKIYFQHKRGEFDFKDILSKNNKTTIKAT